MVPTTAAVSLSLLSLVVSLDVVKCSDSSPSPTEDGIPNFDFFSSEAKEEMALLTKYLKDYDASSIDFIDTLKKSNSASKSLQEYYRKIEAKKQSDCDIITVDNHFKDGQEIINGVVDKCAETVPKYGREKLRSGIEEALEDVQALDDELRKLSQSSKDSLEEGKAALSSINDSKIQTGRFKVVHRFKNALFYRSSYMDSCVKEKTEILSKQVEVWKGIVDNCAIKT